jgi:hypothetical protein
VREAKRAMAIPSAVKRPKKIVGKKLDSTKIENPTLIVVAV